MSIESGKKTGDFAVYAKLAASTLVTALMFGCTQPEVKKVEPVTKPVIEKPYTFEDFFVSLPQVSKYCSDVITFDDKDGKVVKIALSGWRVFGKDAQFSNYTPTNSILPEYWVLRTVDTKNFKESTGYTTIEFSEKDGVKSASVFVEGLGELQLFITTKGLIIFTPKTVDGKTVLDLERIESNPNC
jgi:hypothetical protein